MENLLKQLIEGQKQLFEGQKQLFSEVKAIRGELAEVKSDIGNLDTKVEKYGQAQQQDVYHLLELTSNKIDTLHTKADAIPRIETKLDIVQHRLFEQETDLRLIKQAK